MTNTSIKELIFWLIFVGSAAYISYILVNMGHDVYYSNSETIFMESVNLIEN